MENDFVFHYLGGIACAAQRIDEFNSEIKSSICVLLGYLNADADANYTTTGGLTAYQEKETDTELLELTDKEISKMPKQFRKEFKTNGLRAHVRKRTRGNSTSFEIRCRKGGLNISVSGATLEETKLKFIQKLEDIQQGRGAIAPNTPTTFDKFVMYYFENFRKRKVTPETYRSNLSRLMLYILPHFGSIRIKDISPQMCQQLIDRLIDDGKEKTAEDVFSILNCTFKAAIKHNILLHNPLDIVIHDKHQRKHGKALTIEEEKRLLEESSEPFRTIFAIFLYTGIRPNEYATARIEGEILYAKNSKRHNGKEEMKRIPITPMLGRYIDSNTIIPTMGVQTIRRAFKTIFNDEHKLYDLRTTFYTRCKMCDIAPAARDEFMGHSSGALGNTYTDLPNDYLIKEGQKLDY